MWHKLEVKRSNSATVMHYVANHHEHCPSAHKAILKAQFTILKCISIVVLCKWQCFKIFQLIHEKYNIWKTCLQRNCHLSKLKLVGKLYNWTSASYTFALRARWWQRKTISQCSLFYASSLIFIHLPYIFSRRYRWKIYQHHTSFHLSKYAILCN